MIAGASYGWSGKVFLLRCITHKRFPHKRFGFLVIFFSPFFLFLSVKGGLDCSSYATYGHIGPNSSCLPFGRLGTPPAHFFNHWSFMVFGVLQSGNLMWQEKEGGRPSFMVFLVIITVFLIHVRRSSSSS